MKQKRILAALLAALLLLLPGQSPRAQAAGGVSKVTMTFGANGADSRAFTWYTDAAVTAGELQVAPLTAGKADFTRSLVFAAQSGVATNAPGQRWHKAAATGLAPDTQYAYRVGSAQTGWSAAGSFRTAGTGGFTFIALTDTQSDTKANARLAANVLTQARRTAPDAAFAVHSGDVTDKGRVEEQWDNTLGAMQADLMDVTLLPAAGNHEPTRYSFVEHFNLPAPPGGATVSGAYYSVDYGPAHLVTLNTNQSNSVYDCLTQTQVDWLKQDVTAARAYGAKWVIVNLHKGMFTAGPYATDREIIGPRGQRAKLMPILEELGVDLVLQGHDHVASRYVNGDGATYVNCGPAGPKMYPRNSKLSPAFLQQFAYLFDKKAQWQRYQGFGVFTVTETAIRGTLYEIDYKTAPDKPYIVDQFTLAVKGN